MVGDSESRPKSKMVKLDANEEYDQALPGEIREVRRGCRGRSTQPAWIFIGTVAIPTIGFMARRSRGRSNERVQRLRSNAQRARCRSLRTRPDRNDRCCSVTQRKMLLSTFVRRPAAALQWIWHSKRNANPGASCRDLLACWRISPTHGASRRGCQRYSCADA